VNINSRISLRCILPIFIPFFMLAVSHGQAVSTSTTLVVSPVGPVASGTVVTLTTTVVSGATPVNPGQVKFCVATAAHCEDSALLATAQLTSAGIAIYKFRPGIGSHSYQAVFVGTNSYAKSASTTADLSVTPTTNAYSTMTTIAASGTTGDYTLTATVVGFGSNTVSPTGEISFLDTTNDNASLGSAELGTATPGKVFASGSMPDVGSAPVSIAVGDFNGDGIPDLVTLNNSDSTMTVLLGNGDGTFTAMPAFSLGSNPESIAVGDFNGDGILDLAISTLGSQDLTILLGNGDGTFTLKSSPLAGNGPTFIAVGDFNGDGIPDLATIESDDGTVKVLQGNGDGTFTTGYVLDIGRNAASALAVGDFNGNGILDLALNSGTILQGNGDGTFTAASETIPSFDDAAVGDFNGDGIVDLATTNGAESVTVLLSNGNGTFTTKSTLTVGNKAGAIAIGDFNGDGITDLATANSGDNTVTVLLGKGDGTFPTQSTLNVGNEPDAIAVTDFNGDGMPGLATANLGDNTVTVLLNELTETATATLNDVSVSGAPTNLVVANYPGDAHFSGSVSDTLALTTSQTPTTLGLSSSANPSSVGSPIILTAVLKPSSSISATTDGESVTFYNNGVSVGTSTLSSGVATLYITPRLVGSTTLTATYAGDANFLGATSNSLIEAVAIASASTTYVVTTNTDTTNGVAANCTGTPTPNCSLRDALAAAAAKGAANITFDPTVFATPQTITLGSAGGLTIPSNTTINITGPTMGSGASLKTLVTVSGGGPVFTVNATNASISGLTVTGGSAPYDGGGILNSGGLTVSDSTISGNNVPQSITTYATGGGIENDGVMTLINSTVTGNNVGLNLTAGCQSCSVTGGGIDNQGTLTITNSTIVGNSAFINLGEGGGISDDSVNGGGINNQGTLTMTNSTVAGNSASGSGDMGVDSVVIAVGGGISGDATTGGTNNVISGNTTNGTEDDCDNGNCPTNGVNGNIVGSNVLLAKLGNYGGPTQTTPPLPGSPAICAGLVEDIPPGITTDQRGFPRTTTYGSNPPCVDSGSVQTNYSVAFSAQPPATVATDSNFTAALQLSESGSPFPVAGVTIPLSLGAGNNGTLSGNSASTAANGIAAFSQLQVSTAGTGDTLVAALPLTTVPPPAPLTSPISANATSSSFNVAATQSATTTTLTASATSASVGTSVTFTASVSPSGTSPAPTGTIQFYDGSSPLGSAVTLTAGSASYSTASLAPGTHTITAVYSGDTNFSTSTSGPVALAVLQVATTLQLYSSANPSAPGASITLTALLSPDIVGAFNTDGETVTFNNGATVLGTATLTNIGLGTSNVGQATFNVTSLPDGTDNLTASYPGDSAFSAATSNSVPQAVNVPFEPIPNFVVAVNTDTTSGVAGNCTTAPATNCSLRDALAAAFAAGSGNITFSPTVFAAPQTITLGNAGGLNIPPHTTITGSTTGSGATLTNLVTVSGGGPVFTVNPSVTNAAISGLTITGGGVPYEGGGILNSGVLTVSDSTISANNANGGSSSFANGGGVANLGSMTLINSSVTGNSASAEGGTQGSSVLGGGIYNSGTLTITNSTIVGNSVSSTPSGTGIANLSVAGGGIYNQGTLTMTNSIVAGNSANASVQGSDPESYAQVSGAGIAGGVNTGTNNIISGNIANVFNYILNTGNGSESEDDCDVFQSTPSCPTNGQNGNIVGPNALLAPLGNYGGPTQTTPPLPGSPAICAGLVADIPPGITTDQRGFPRTTTYGSNPPCVDSGSVQANYSVAFSTQPPATVAADSNFTAALQLSESGSPFPVAGVAIPLSLGTGNNGALSGNSASTAASGIATFSQLKASAAGTGDTLVAALPLTTVPPPAPLTSPISVTATSSAFDVIATQSTTTTTLTASAMSTAFGTSVTFTASVSPSGTSPAPTGTVQFYDGSTPLGSAVTLTAGSASYSTTSLAPGAHTITAVYSGDTNFISSTSAAITENIEDVTPVLGSPSVSVAPGGSVTETLTLTALGGLNEATTFACSGLPAGASCSFNPMSVTGSGSTTLTITTTGSTAALIPEGRWLPGGGAAVACIILLIWPNRRRRWAQMLGILVLCFVFSTTGCGGGGMSGGGGGGTGSSGTPAGTYTVTVTTTTGSGSSAISNTVTFQLTVT
jgi:hypothetical protein